RSCPVFDPNFDSPPLRYSLLVLTNRSVKPLRDSAVGVWELPGNLLSFLAHAIGAKKSLPIQGQTLAFVFMMISESDQYAKKRRKIAMIGVEAKRSSARPICTARLRARKKTSELARQAID